MILDIQKQQTLEQQLKKEKDNPSSFAVMNSMTPPDTKWHTLLNNRLQSFMPDFYSRFRSTVFREWKKAIKAYIMDKTDRRAVLQKLWMPDASNLYKPYIKNLVDKIFNRLYDTRIKLEVVTEDPNYKDWEETIKALNEWAWLDPENRTNLFTSIKHQCVAGNGFGKAWIKSSSEWDFKLVFQNVPLFNLYFNIDQDFYNSWLLIVERQIKPILQIIDEISWLVPDITNEMISTSTRNPRPFSSYDDNRIWDNWTMQDLNYWLISTQTKWTAFDQDNIYKITEFWNEVCELSIWFSGTWDNANVFVAVNWWVRYDGKNPLWMHPYVNLMYDTSTGRQISRGIGIIHWDEQLEFNAIFNSFFDQVRRSSIEMRVKKGSGKIKWLAWTFEPQHWKVLEIEWDMELIKFGEFKVDPNMLSIMQFISSEWDRVNWLTGYTGWEQQGIERSPFAAQAQVQITLQALKPAVEGISNALSYCSYVWQKLAKNYMDKSYSPNKFKVKIFDQIHKLDKKFFEGRYKIIYSNQSIVSLMAEEKLLKNQQMMQGIQALATDPATGNYLLEQDLLLEEVLEAWDFDKSLILTTPEYYKKVQANEIAKMDMQLALIEKQKELATAQKELQAIQNPQPPVPVEMQQPLLWPVQEPPRVDLAE
jgi:hypothetical protein